MQKQEQQSIGSDKTFVSEVERLKWLLQMSLGKAKPVKKGGVTLMQKKEWGKEARLPVNSHPLCANEAMTMVLLCHSCTTEALGVPGTLGPEIQRTDSQFSLLDLVWDWKQEAARFLVTSINTAWPFLNPRYSTLGAAGLRVWCTHSYQYLIAIKPTVGTVDCT